MKICKGCQAMACPEHLEICCEECENKCEERCGSDPNEKVDGEYCFREIGVSHE